MSFLKKDWCIWNSLCVRFKADVTREHWALRRSRSWDECTIFKSSLPGSLAPPCGLTMSAQSHREVESHVTYMKTKWGIHRACLNIMIVGKKEREKKNKLCYVTFQILFLLLLFFTFFLGVGCSNVVWGFREITETKNMKKCSSKALI